MDFHGKMDIAQSKRNHLGHWLAQQDYKDLIERVKSSGELNGTERKRLKDLEDKDYYDSLYDKESFE